MDIRIEQRRNELMGKEFVNRRGHKCFIVEYYSATKVLVVFYRTMTFDYFTYRNLQIGGFLDYNEPSLLGVGYLGEKQSMKSTPSERKAYRAWSHILHRCYDEKVQERHPRYKGCTVSKEWLSFKNFKEWYIKQPQLLYKEDSNGNRWSIDKDILVRGNKVYSAETCCVVPNEINILIVKPSHRSEHDHLPEGVGYIKPKTINSKIGYTARVHKGNGESDRYLGYYDTPEEAFLFYKQAKEERIKEVANKWKGKIADNVYDALMKWEVGV